MKNIQIIDNAENCTYSVYSISVNDYKIIFPEENQDIEFNTDFEKRITKEKLIELNKRLWENPIEKKMVNGIDGTIFYNSDFKKKHWPTKKEKEIKTII